MKMLERLFRFFRSIGFDGLLFLNALRGLPVFIKNYFLFKKEFGKNNKEFKWGNLYPQLADRFDYSGSTRGHYFHQDLLVAQKIFLNNPQKYVDIGSRIDGFVAHVASFREIEVFDIRRLDNTIKNVKFRRADFTQNNFKFEDYCDSVSSLHAIEHFGLGRYGDKLDFFGYLKGLDNIYKMLKKAGKFYFSVPIGEQRIEFDAHRIFSITYLIQLFKDRYIIDSFSYIDDKWDLHTNVQLDDLSIRNNFNCSYGCGIFELTKI